jgi:hypothetical protein
MNTETISFTQYLFPDRRKEIIEIPQQASIVEKANFSLEKGYSFDIENNQGRVWMTCR